MTLIRGSYPARRRIYWIQDNLSANGTPDIRRFAAANNIEPVASPNLRRLAAETQHRIAA